MSHPKLESIRLRYHYACRYCGVTEVTVGGELTVDHYRPRVERGTDEDNNLVYACIRCNQYKGDFWPNDAELAQGQRILHPLQDDPTIHLIEDQRTGHLQALTDTGRFHIALLKLNRPQLVEHRLISTLQQHLTENQRLLAQQIEELQKTITAQELYITLLEIQLGLREP